MLWERYSWPVVCLSIRQQSCLLFGVKCAGNIDPATTNEVDDSDDDLAAPLGKSTQLTAEQGLKHLLLTVDVERLYRSVPPAAVS